MKSPIRRGLLTCLATALPIAGALTLPGGRAMAQALNTVRIIVPLGPGSGADNVSRFIAPRLGKSVVVENCPGADMLIAVQACSAARCARGCSASAIAGAERRWAGPVRVRLGVSLPA